MASKIPTESKARGKIGSTKIPDYLSTQVASPKIAADAKQTYTKLAGTDVTGSGVTMSSPTTAGTTTTPYRVVTPPSAITSSTGTTTGVTAPSALTQRTMTAATAGTPTAATSATQANLAANRQVAGQTRGTVTGAATGASANPVTSAIAQAAQGNVNQQALAAAVTGQKATVTAQTASLPGNIQAAVTTNPASVTAATVNNPAAVNAQIASIPADTLVSGQMEKLLTGIETGTIPTWARAAVEAVDANLASRGMSRSSIGRDSLVNAIIQSAIPIAQANATQLQQAAMANLNNQQQNQNLTSQNLDFDS